MTEGTPTRMFASPTESWLPARLAKVHAREVLVGRLAIYVWSFFLFLAAIGLTTSNPYFTAGGLLIPPLLFQLLWRSGEPPVLLFGASFQWLQAYAPVISANLSGTTLTAQFGGPELETAGWLSLLGIVVLAVGMRTGLRRISGHIPAAATEQAGRLSAPRLFAAYLVGLGLSVALAAAAIGMPSLRQPLIALATIKSIPVFLIAWHAIQGRRNYHWFGLVFGIELLLGFSGFFSGFKNVLFLMLVVTAGATSGSGRLSLSKIAATTAVLVVLVGFWQAVKTEYRQALNQGTGMQNVSMPLLDRYLFLIDQAEQVTPEEMALGFSAGIRRLGYIQYFAYSLRHVPRYIPHQDGDLWLGAIKHVFMPRFLFPDKPAIHDSRRTMKFTGQIVADERRGTSISIGYMGESYIDFGVFGMYVPIFLLGVYYGLIYRYFSRIRGYELLGMATAVSLLLYSAHLIETSNIKIVGGLTAGTIILSGLLLFARRSLWTLLCRPAR